MTLARQIIDLLDEERDLLVSGGYDRLENLVSRKEALEGRLSDDSSLDHATLERIAARTTRNADLIEAARRGFKQAEAQISDIRKGMTQATYGSDGARHSLVPPHARIEQKF